MKHADCFAHDMEKKGGKNGGNKELSRSIYAAPELTTPSLCRLCIQQSPDSPQSQAQNYKRNETPFRLVKRISYEQREGHRGDE